MSTPILATKLYIPPLRPKVMLRSRLIEQLNEGLHRKLTIISAPAGFGKTTLVSAWLRESDCRVAWLSLDEGDNDPTRFLTYLISALQTIAADIGQAVLATLQSPQSPPIASILTPLLNEIVTIPDDFVLILDDYHLIDARVLDDALTFLIEHMPPQMHIVIATREDPQLPLARLRARGELTELRAVDLRFNPSEVAHFLNEVMRLNLSTPDVVALETRTEGWIAGLQLAAISMQGQQDTTAFIQSFTGSHHFVFDYLLEEVLQQQSENVQTFLLQTSVLDRLCGSLCDAILLDTSISGQEMLEYIEQANLFIIPLDSERRWYRYHHLFADLLQQRLQKQMSTEGGQSKLSELHVRASQWYEENGLELEAFQHAAAANDIDRAERLLYSDGKPIYFRGVVTPILNWIESLPAYVIDSRPSLSLIYAWLLTFIGIDTAHVEQRLKSIEVVLKASSQDAHTRDFLGQIASIRAMLAIPINDVDTMISQARHALKLLHPDNAPVRLNTAWTLAFAYQAQGNRAEARERYQSVIPMSQASDNIMITLAATLGLGGIQQSDNQLHRATETLQRALQLAGNPPMSPASVAHLGLGEIYYEWNDLDKAEHHGQLSIQLGEQMESVDLPISGGILLSRVRLARGDIKAALKILSEVEQAVHQRNLMFRLPDIAAVKVLIFLRQGKEEEAAKLTEEFDIPISRVRVYLAQGDVPSALAILEPQIQEVEARGWVDEQLKLLVLQALAHYQGEQLDQAIQILEKALKMAVSDGFIRTFLDEGLIMAELLSEAVTPGIMSDYNRKLLSTFDDENQALSFSSPQPLIESLSERELEVLHLVAEGLSNREIADPLFLAIDTLKGHNRRIYAKLQVQRRTEAVARARELGLLSS